VIKFKHDGLHLSCRKTCCKGYDGAYVSKCNLEVEPFVVRWVVQNEEEMCELRVVEDRMSPWGVVGRCCYFKKERMLIDHKPNNYDWSCGWMSMDCLN